MTEKYRENYDREYEETRTCSAFILMSGVSDWKWELQNASDVPNGCPTELAAVQVLGP